MREEGREVISSVMTDRIRVLTGVTGLGVECSSVVLRHCNMCLYVGYERCKCG